MQMKFTGVRSGSSSVAVVAALVDGASAADDDVEACW